MTKRKPQDCSHLINKLEAEVETTNRRLDRWKDRTMPAFGRTVESKQCKERALERLRHQAGSQKSKDSGSGDSKQSWYKSSPDILNRRQIILKNRGLSAQKLCKVFDGRRVPLPSGWEEEFKVTEWFAAYRNPTLRARIQRIISTDRKQK